MLQQHKPLITSVITKGCRKFQNLLFGTGVPSYSSSSPLVLRRYFHSKSINTNNKTERMEVVNQNFDEVVARMKLFEGQYDSKVNFDISDQQPIVMRFDGFHFKSFTTNGDIFEKPFDANIHWALLLAVRDLCLKNLSMTPTLIYNCSDELTLLFSAQASTNEKQQKIPNGIYRGRAQKLVSISTSFLTITFNYYLRKLLRANADSFESRLEYDMHNSKISKKSYNSADFEKRRLVRQKLLDGEIFGNFDCRIYQLPTISHAIDYMIWRQIDCIRNSKTTLGSKFYAQNEMNFLSASKIVEMVEQEKGVNWDDFPNEYKYGTFIKKIKYFKTGYNPKTNTHVNVERVSFLNQCVKLNHCTSEKITELVTNPFWTHNVFAMDGFSKEDKLSLHYPNGISFTFGTQPYIFGMKNSPPPLHKDHLGSADNENIHKFISPTLASMLEMEHLQL